jgi:hypothetical protein
MLVVCVISIGAVVITQMLNTKNNKLYYKQFTTTIDSLKTINAQHIKTIDSLGFIKMANIDTIKYYKQLLKTISNDKEIIKYNFMVNDSVIITFDSYITKYNHLGY